MDPLELDTRRRLFDVVRRHPGKYLRELQRETGLAMGALEYHLAFLEKAGLVTVAQEANKRFFPAAMDRRDKPVLSELRKELTRRSLLILLRDGRSPKSMLLGELDVSPSTLNYHLRHLDHVGLIRTSHEGREAVYELLDSERVRRLLIAYRTSFVDRMVDAFLDGFESMRSRPTASQTR